MNNLLLWISLVTPLTLAAPAMAADRTVVDAPAPAYPADAQRQKVEGCAIVRYVVLPDGATDQVAVVDARPQGVFEKSAIQTVNGWKFAAAGEPSYHMQAFYFQMDSTTDEHARHCTVPSRYRGRVVPASS